MKCINCHDEGFFYAPDGDAPMVERYCSCPAGVRRLRSSSKRARFSVSDLVASDPPSSSKRARFSVSDLVASDPPYEVSAKEKP